MRTDSLADPVLSRVQASLPSRISCIYISRTSARCASQDMRVRRS